MADASLAPIEQLAAVSPAAAKTFMDHRAAAGGLTDAIGPWRLE
jgi:hypothetical protein